MPSHLTVGPALDAARYLATDQLVWFTEDEDLPVEVLLNGVPESGRFAAQDPDSDPATYPGVYGVTPLELAVPGPAGRALGVPCAGLTYVGVHPDHRRRGILTAMMRDHFARSHEAGVVVSALHASEPLIYGRHGYGLASLEHVVTWSRGAMFTAPGLDEEAESVRVRLASVADAGMPQRLRSIDLRLLPSTPGMVVGSIGLYEDALRDRVENLRGTEPRRVLIAQRDGEDVGYVQFQRTHKWERARPSATVEASRLHGAPTVRLALLRRLVDLDLAGSIEVREIGIDDEVMTWLPGPRGADGVETYDSLWVRLIDVPGALIRRGYAADGDVVIDVADTAAPWNAGRWRLQASGGAAEVTRTEAEADVSLSVDVLGAVYLGGRNLLTMRDAGLLTEHRSGAVRELSQALRTDRAPAAAVGF